MTSVNKKLLRIIKSQNDKLNSLTGEELQTLEKKYGKDVLKKALNLKRKLFQLGIFSFVIVFALAFLFLPPWNVASNNAFNELTKNLSFISIAFFLIIVLFRILTAVASGFLLLFLIGVPLFNYLSKRVTTLKILEEAETILQRRKSKSS